eukprot:scaffold23098_cov163-Skeletonema_dohrnii-CCMP3373.AAC.1
MARLTILLVALVAAMATAFAPVPLSRTGELIFKVVEVINEIFGVGGEMKGWRRVPFCVPTVFLLQWLCSIARNSDNGLLNCHYGSYNTMVLFK